MQIQALKNKLTGEIIYSRARHDFRQFSDESGFIDGGFDYFRCGSNGLNNMEKVVVEINTDAGKLYEDWANGGNRFGIAVTYTPAGIKIEAPELIRVVPKEEWEDFDSFGYKKQCLIWGTYGPKGDQPKKMIALIHADTDHLEAILKTQIHIGDDTRKTIQSILSDRV